MIQIFQEDDKVIMDLNGRHDAICLTCDEALRTAEALDQRADDADALVASMKDVYLFKGEVWDAKVESYDGEVWIRFWPPPTQIGKPTRVPMPACTARRMAEMIRSKESFARHRMRLVLQGAN